ncbi:hypothetical protein [Virgibacillus salexigens]|uniref:hypothetical protein n=1 Tax=Virgibacillus salexigens TaxID=61016 RepID=UPI003081695A
MKWLNNEYIKAADLGDVIELAVPHLVEAGKLSANMDAATKEWVEKVIALYKDQLRNGAEIVELTDMFFNKENAFDEGAMDVLQEEQVPEV